MSRNGESLPEPRVTQDLFDSGGHLADFARVHQKAVPAVGYRLGDSLQTSGHDRRPHGERFQNHIGDSISIAVGGNHRRNNQQIRRCNEILCRIRIQPSGQLHLFGQPVLPYQPFYLFPLRARPGDDQPDLRPSLGNQREGPYEISITLLRNETSDRCKCVRARTSVARAPWGAGDLHPVVADRKPGVARWGQLAPEMVRRLSRAGHEEVRTRDLQSYRALLHEYVPRMSGNAQAGTRNRRQRQSDACRPA